MDTRGGDTCNPTLDRDVGLRSVGMRLVAAFLLINPCLGTMRVCEHELWVRGLHLTVLATTQGENGSDS